MTPGLPDKAPITSARNLKLDVLRGIAISLLLVLHAGVLTPGLADHARLSDLVMRMSVGMQLFFVLSGYLISASLTGRGQAPGHLRRFYIHRAAKIFPLYLLFLHLYIVAYLLQRDRPGFTPMINSLGPATFTLPNYLAHWVFLQGLIPRWIHTFVDGSWSLAAEWYFYILAPWIIVRFAKTPQLALRALIVAIFIGVATGVVTSSLPNYWSYYSFPSQAASFMVGVAAFRIHQTWHATLPTKLLREALLLVAIVGLGLFQAESAPIGMHVVYSLLFGIGLMLVLLMRQAPALPFPWSILAHLGRMSYALFFAHLFLLKLLNPWVITLFEQSGFAMMLTANLAIAFGGSWLASFFVLDRVDRYFVARAKAYGCARPATDPAANAIVDPTRDR